MNYSHISLVAKIWVNILLNHRHFGYNKKWTKKSTQRLEVCSAKKRNRQISWRFFFFFPFNKTKFGCPEERRRLFGRRRRSRSLIVLRLRKMCVWKLLLFLFCFWREEALRRTSERFPWSPWFEIWENFPFSS